MENSKQVLTGKIVLITGGTGSFGHAATSKFLKLGVKEIRILSRDEKKQDDMRKEFDDDRLKFYIGDIRDYASIHGAFRGVDYVFNAAALKQVPSCEFYPLEAVKTNIIGSDNVVTACVENKVKKAVFLSTDKAAYPINAMGMSKALMEKNIIARSRQMIAGDTIFCLTRYGNVMGSRGSVIPLFVEQAHNHRPLTITNPRMTRFMMSLDDAVELVLYAFENGEQGDTFIKKGPAVDIETLADAILDLTKSKGGKTYIGTRHGEKVDEVLITSEEMLRAEEYPDFFCIKADNRDLNYDKYVSQGYDNNELEKMYTSQNTKQLSFAEIKSLLQELHLL
ncbi:MAG: polysaccharide biosynthesis protein [Bacilli bacterium]|jgi:UDP-glucose 4-epimerase|nr:polysaccharide biosynthesis protein [Bacilli bacterium]MCH4236286.1 polysaccharide biosynthesis protein [Bacilli bacterium]HMM00291.1 polysaccharide biosynthesis protein [Bacilli bacterium]